ncbi:hypothetical protein [Streptomyces sp. SID13726]|uniref:hypothetical protein n=1 Tax=Streptomyces sp. SID13726 TaxID=2706058 RepID=UPI0013BC13CB|nr:hypothetical protein [Streptomyces sp. SID13726]NEB02804.1 hypothetical protein [Streptomyces sp. SID13726]
MTSMSGEPRADRFVRELAELRIPDPAAARTTLWLRLGATLMVLGLALAASAYLVTHTTQNPLDQRDGLALGLGGIAATVVGAALFLRYSLTGFLRFWMARQSYDLAVLAGRRRAAPSRETIPAPPAGKDLNHDLASTDPAPR